MEKVMETLENSINLYLLVILEQTILLTDYSCLNRSNYFKFCIDLFSKVNSLDIDILIDLDQ